MIEGIYVVLGFVELREDEFMYVIVVFKKDYFIVIFMSVFDIFRGM